MSVESDNDELVADTAGTKRTILLRVKRYAVLNKELIDYFQEVNAAVKSLEPGEQMVVYVDEGNV